MEIDIQIAAGSDQPKYLQVVDAVIENISKGNLKKGHQLPSIAELASSQSIAKVTIAKAYDVLKEKGIILSRHGKGFYISSTEIKVTLNIFVLFDTMNAYKEILYSSLKKSLPADAHCSIFFHHYDIKLFSSLIKNSIGKYNYYVVMPHFDEDVSPVLQHIPPDKLLLLDKNVPLLHSAYAAVYQDFETDVLQSLSTAKSKIMKYRRFYLIAGNKSFQYVPLGIINGFKKFCKKEGILFSIQQNLTEDIITENNAYLIFSDADLFSFIKFCNKANWILGTNIGLISYDETPMKELLLNGITVISTDFVKMGEKAGELIRSGKQEQIPNIAGIIFRNSL